ncbi:MAG: hypothetical protein ACI4DO_01520 [Roseburia sp.]
MGLFRRKKKEKKNIAEVLSAVTEDVLSEKERKDTKKVHHYVLGHCEQIIQTAKNLEEEKKEYRTLTAYLTDVQTLENLSEKEAQDLRDTANSIVTLNQSREDYLHSAKKLTESQFAQMQRDEDILADAIRTLQANEAYQSAVKRDMNYLEGEKVEWTYYHQELEDEQKILRVVSWVAFVVLVLLLGALMVMLFVFDLDVLILFAVLLFVAAVLGSFLLLRMQNNTKEMRRANVNRNHAISLLNKAKIKYVHSTNAVDYACEKYHVHNSYELTYMWEQYMEAVRELEKYQRNSEDLEYFTGKLLRLLRKYNLYDVQIWQNQLHALIDKREMVEIKHDLLERRQKVRAQMEYDLDVVDEQREEIENLMKEFHEEIPEVREILNSVDRLIKS